MLKIYAYLLVVLCLVTGVCRAAPIYDNTSVDTLSSVMFSTGYVQLGDQVQLAAPSQLASLETQFFNLGDETFFDATLRFYTTGTLAQIGSSFTVTGLLIGAFESLNVAFSDLGGLAVPADVIAMVVDRQPLRGWRSRAEFVRWTDRRIVQQSVVLRRRRRRVG